MIQPVWAGIVGVVIAGALLTSTDADRTVLALLAAATLTAPIGWIYSAWWFIGPGLAVWVGGSKGTRRGHAVVAS